MLITVSPKTRTTLAKHSAGWRVKRLLSDRDWKRNLESPDQWGAHRDISAADRIRLVNFRFEQLAALYRYRGLRP